MLKVHLCSPFTSVVLLNFMHAFYLHGVLSLPCGLFTPTWPFITMWDLSPPWSPPPGLGVRGALRRHCICDNFVTRHLAEMYLRKFATESIFTASIIWFYIWELDYVILAPLQASAPCSRLGALPRCTAVHCPRPATIQQFYLNPLYCKIWIVMPYYVYCTPILDVADLKRRVIAAWMVCSSTSSMRQLTAAHLCGSLWATLWALVCISK